MKKIFSFILLFSCLVSLAFAQEIRGTAHSWQGGDPGLKTVGARAISGGIAFKVLYNSLDTRYDPVDSPIMYVEYGPNSMLGFQTDSRYQEVGNRTEEYTVTGVDNTQQHYYRAVLMYNNKTAYGEILEYIPQKVSSDSEKSTSTTTAPIEADNEIISQPTLPSVWPWNMFTKKDNEPGFFQKLFGKNKNTAQQSLPRKISKNGVSLSLTNNTDETSGGQKTTYVISYANISGKTLDNIDIELLLPPEYSFISSNKGDYHKDVHTVLVPLYVFQPKERGTIEVEVYASEKKSNKQTQASAHLYTNDSETVVYDVDNYRAGKSTGLRTARGSDGETRPRVRNNASSSSSPFSGSTMIGWLIIGAIVGGVVFVSYKFFKKDKY